ncbi:hypothetical protein T492DRAFT_835625, partial [Pavlovales sp. CCMP2436]
EPVIRKLSPPADVVDEEELRTSRTLLPFFRSTGAGMQFDASKSLGNTAQRFLYTTAPSHAAHVSTPDPPRQIGMAYPTGVRDGELLSQLPFSKQSGRQGFIKHAADMLFSGAIMKENYLALCDHDTFGVNMMHYALDDKESADTRRIVQYPKQPSAPCLMQLLSNQHAFIEEQRGLGQQQVQSTCALLQSMLGEFAAALQGTMPSGMHARTATLVGGGSGFSALQRDTMGMRGDGTAAPFAVQPTQPPQPRAQSDELLRFNESMRVLEQAASLQQQQPTAAAAAAVALNVGSGPCCVGRKKLNLACAQAIT